MSAGSPTSREEERERESSESASELALERASDSDEAKRIIFSSSEKGRDAYDPSVCGVSDADCGRLRLVTAASLKPVGASAPRRRSSARATASAVCDAGNGGPRSNESMSRAHSGVFSLVSAAHAWRDTSGEICGDGSIIGNGNAARGASLRKSNNSKV